MGINIFAKCRIVVKLNQVITIVDLVLKKLPEFVSGVKFDGINNKDCVLSTCWNRHFYLKTITIRIKIHITIVLPFVLYGCETWSLTLREERRLRVLENRVLRRVFGLKREEVTGEWRKLHNKKLSDLYSLPNIVGVVK